MRETSGPKGELYRPSPDGVTVYLNGGRDISGVLKRVEKYGGEVIMQQTDLGEEAGYVGMFVDSEGNKVGLQFPRI